MLSDEIYLPSPYDTHVAHLIFFVTGNPGVIAFYQRFLRLVHEKLNSKIGENGGVAVYGCSLGGFETERTTKIHSLDEQETLLLRALESAKSRSAFARDGDERTDCEVTLIGHSVGTYLVLKLLQTTMESTNGPKDRYRFHNGILLFPTVLDLAESPSGRILRWPLAVPGLATVVGSLIRLVARSLPTSLLEALVLRSPEFRGAPPGPERNQAAGIIVELLRSPLGVRECLTLAAQELQQITSDRFPKEIWGAADPDTEQPLPSSQARTKLFFYFGMDDRWVANKTRENLVRTRAFPSAISLSERNWMLDNRPWMEVDKLGVKHDFCNGYNEPIAEKVCEYMREVFRSD